MKNSNKDDNRIAKPTSNCLICCGDIVKLFDVYDDRYGFPGFFGNYRCLDCGHGQILADFAPEQLAALYTDYYPRSSFNIDSYKPAPPAKGFKAWFDGLRRAAYLWVPENVRVLDIGCGFGQTLGYHKSRGCDVYGVETDRNILRVAERFGFNVHNGPFDALNYPESFFDYVTMDQVLEHMLDPLDTLRGVARVLKPGGVVILSVPNASGWGARLFGRFWINWHAPYHLQHFTLSSLRLAARKSGLVVARQQVITSSEWLFYQWNHLLFYPAEGTPSAFWSPDMARVRNGRLAYRTLAILHRAKLNHILTRLFDILGVGDSYLFFLRKP